MAVGLCFIWIKPMSIRLVVLNIGLFNYLDNWYWGGWVDAWVGVFPESCSRSGDEDSIRVLH